MPTIRVNGASLAYDEAGAGPVVVFSHAAAGDRRMWEHQFQELSADHRVIRYDWRGYGGSGLAAGEFGHHEDLLALLDGLDVDRATLVGCSMGGAHALDVALLAPHRVDALVLICSGLSGHVWPAAMVARARELILREVPEQRLNDYRLRRIGRVRPEDVAATARAQAQFLVAGPHREPAQVDPRVWQAAVEMLEGVFRREWNSPMYTERGLDPPAAGRLGEVRVPTLVINGRLDVPEIQEVSDLLAAGIAGARRLDLDGAAHLPPLECPTEVTAAIRDFLPAVVAR